MYRKGVLSPLLELQKREGRKMKTSCACLPRFHLFLLFVSSQSIFNYWQANKTDWRAAKMASAAPFNRRQWASHSLRVTAKELSIVSARGKNNAIAERFSKWVSHLRSLTPPPPPRVELIIHQQPLSRSVCLYLSPQEMRSRVLTTQLFFSFLFSVKI